MLTWLRLRRPQARITRIAGRSVKLFDLRFPRLSPLLWRSPYCCTLVYFWTAVVTEDICAGRYTEPDKRRLLQRAFAATVAATGGDPPAALARVLPDGHGRRRRALADLRRVVELYRGEVDEGAMLHADYRAAVEGDGRPAPARNRWGLRRQTAHDLLLASDLATELRKLAAERQPRRRT